MRRKIRTGLFLAMAVLLGVSLAAAADKPPVKIGVVSPVTGQGASIAKDFADGLYLALEMINNGGGILGEERLSSSSKMISAFPRSRWRPPKN